MQIAQGMQFLHANGILHGELRPENILIDGQLQSHSKATSPFATASAQSTTSTPHDTVPSANGDNSSCAWSGQPPSAAARMNDGVQLGSVAPAGATGTAVAAPATATGAITDTSLHEAPFCVKLKDIGLCYGSVQNRILHVKKLAGRSRQHAVRWLPPECFRGDGLSKYTDVYAFGMLMWELYTGQVGDV
eukprot:jgi/Chrzof1/2646/Cz11g23210.t1